MKTIRRVSVAVAVTMAEVATFVVAQITTDVALSLDVAVIVGFVDVDFSHVVGVAENQTMRMCKETMLKTLGADDKNDGRVFFQNGQI